MTGTPVMIDLKNQSVAQIKKSIDALPFEQYDLWISALSADTRKGVRALAEKLVKRQAEREKLIHALNVKKQVENDLRAKGFRFICGIDEVGRGPLAGPVVAGAVILPEDFSVLGIDDSKKLSHAKRAKLAEAIKGEAISYAVSEVSPAVIDDINILEATKLAMSKAVESLAVTPDFLLIDALSIPSAVPVKPVVHGDALCLSIGAASIIAKEHRDDLMREYDAVYPGYGLASYMGYGSAKHIEAIKTLGPTPIHRKSFIQNFVR